ncbi:MAG TPA: carboxymuconolactone decarboxylase family protein [Reyranella sp.]|nr:carboxymuconolactone decarboxylase family protein [Reyranella sp.]
MPDLYRVLGHAPAMFEAWLDFAWPLRQRAKTPRKLRELMILRGAQMYGTTYEWAHHLPMALAAGVSELQIDSLANWKQSTHFDAQERAALELAEEVTRGPGASKQAIERLRLEGFEEEALVELVLTASFYVCVGRLLHSFEIQPEPGYEEQVKRMDPANFD